MPEIPDPAVTTCPLCGSSDTRLYHQDSRRHYVRCGACALVFVPAVEHVPAAAEKAQYDLHENALDDPGYRAFLSRLAVPVLARAASRAVEGGPALEGIDVGCGPAPLLALMLGEGGIRMAHYDPVYSPDATALTRRYEVVTASEVVEHFRDPGREFARLFALLKPGGLLGIMTKRTRDAAAFAHWHYILDPTHVAFYAEATFAWIAAHFGARLEIVGEDVVVFTARADENAATMQSAPQ